ALIECVIPGQVCPRAPTRQARCPFRDRTRKKRRGSVTAGVRPVHRICTTARATGFMARPSRTGPGADPGPEACAEAVAWPTETVTTPRAPRAETTARTDGTDAQRPGPVRPRGDWRRHVRHAGDVGQRRARRRRPVPADPPAGPGRHGRGVRGRGRP